MVERVEVPVEPTPAEAPAPTPDVAQRPDHVPEKFWDAEKGEVRHEELYKSYAELERKFSDQQNDGQADAPNPEADKEPETKTEDKTEEKSEETTSEVATVGEFLTSDKMREFSDTYYDNLEKTGEGKLNETDYDALSKFGLSREFIDEQVAARAALSERIVDGWIAEAGGQEQYEASVVWANTAMSAEQLDSIQSRLDSGDQQAGLAAMKDLRTAYENAHGIEPALTPSSRASTGGEVYESMAQVTADVNKPEYHNDPAFRRRVEAKLAMSNLL